MSKTTLTSLSTNERNSLANIDEDDVEERTVELSSIQINERIKIPEDDLNTVDIPTDLHEHFECVVGKHLFLDKPWTKISHKKIIDDLQLHKFNSCFWPHRKKLEGVKNGHVLVGYRPFRNTDEEFVICTTDKANQYIEGTRAQSDRELKQKVERAICRVPGRWDSENGENDIEDVKPARTRDKYKWKLPAGRVNAKAEFQDSDSKSAKNEYVKLEPRPKEKFKCIDILIKDSSVQTVGEMVNTGTQTIPKMHDNKGIQSVAVEEEMFQLQPFTDSNKALDAFLKKHVPNFVEQLHYNELYDIYRDDYKLLKNENEIPFDQNVSAIKFLPGHQNVVTNKKYVSCHTWHPTISGIFAVSYMANNNALYKSYIQTPVEEITKPTVKHKKYDIVSSDNEKSLWDNQLNLVDLNYNEKIMSLLNKEFVQRMRIIQVNDNEQLDEQHNHDIIRQLWYSINYTTDSNSTQKSQHKTTKYTIQNERSFKEFVDETLIDGNVNEEHNELMNSDNIEEWNDKNDLNSKFSTDEIEYDMQTKDIKEEENFTNSFTSINVEDIGKKTEIDHHDSDTESFYNIWGDDEEWFFGNRLRNVVRNIHREFNKKYDRQAREHKLLTYLKSEKTYTERNKDSADMNKEKMKLAQDMFKAGDMCKMYNVKSHVESKSKNKRKSTVQRKNKYKILQNEDESMIKREKTPLIEENNNLVVIWSISDNIFPQLRLESPEEVCCVEFNPRNGDTIVGGLTNGQICVWDIKGKLDTTDSKEFNLSEKEKMHYKHLWTQMSWSIDVNFKTKIRPVALSAILESHDSMVTAIQWIHPMNEITTRGRFTRVEDHFSSQFFSASMDGTVKCWDLYSMPLRKLKEEDEVTSRFGRPKNLENYESPLKIYNNRLKPTYTILITEPESDTCSPITAMSFQIPSMQYKYTSDQPFVIGKRQFEFVPTTPNETNRLLVVGNIMGQIGVVTWNGYDVDVESRNQEDCKHIWWGHVHDGPINCIKRNMFFPDIHLVCGGHVISMWSLDYKGYPIWWKRFDEFTNSVLWSTVHPAQFRVSFNTGGILQFWDFMKYTHQPYFTSDILIGDGLIATLSTPHPLTRYSGAKQFAFAEGINEVMDHEKYELISFSDFAGTIIMITIDAIPVKLNEIEDVRSMFRDEVDRRKELDEWNDKYKERFGTMSENNVNDDYSPRDEVSIPDVIPTKNDVLGMTQEQISRRICEESFKWYSERKGPATRSGKMRDNYLEKEARYRVDIMMKKKNVDKKQLAECLKGTKKKDDDDESDLTKIRLKANETYKEVMKKLLAAEQNKEYVFEIDSKKSINSQDVKQIFEKIYRLLVADFVEEKEKFIDDIKNNEYKAEQEDWARVIGNADEDVRNYLVDKHCFKLENLRGARAKWTRAYADDGEKRRKAIGERRRTREAKSDRPTKENDDPPDRDDERLRKTDDDLTGEHHEQQSYDGFEGEIGEGDDRGYPEYSSSGDPAESERPVTDEGEHRHPETLDEQRYGME